MSAFSNRQSIRDMNDQINDASSGDTILASIDAEIASLSSSNDGKGQAFVDKALEDSADNVKAMKRRALGARNNLTKTIKPDPVFDSNASLARDWLTASKADEEAESEGIIQALSDKIATQSAALLTAESSMDENFLRTGRLDNVRTLTQDPDSIRTDAERIEDSQYLSGSGVGIEDRIFAPEPTDEAYLQTGVLPAGGDTGNGLMSSLRPEARSFTTASSTTESNGLMRSLRPEARPDNIIEDIQLQQDIDIDPMVIAKPVLKGKPIPFSEGSVKGLVNTYTVNGVDRSIIDVGQTTVSESYYSSRPRTKIDPQNVVMHYTATEYSGGVRHYMNSFVGRNNVTAAFLVDRSGKIYQTFDPTVKGAHVHGSRTRNPNQIITNSNSIGVEVVATEQNPPSAKQLEASSWLADYLTAQYGTSRVLAHPQANVHKGDIEGFDIVNHWRKGKGLPELTVSEEAIENLLTLAPSRSLRPQKRPN